jgi:hypothetical protein
MDHQQFGLMAKLCPSDERTCRYGLATFSRSELCPPLVRGQWASGKEFTDRLFGLRKRAATGAHQFDQL